MQFKTAAAIAACMASLVGCTADAAPPFEDLPLRDALQAEPHVVAAASSTQRRTLADRLERDGDARHDAQLVTHASSLSASDAIAQLDAARSERGDDAWVLVRLRSGTAPGSFDAEPFATPDLATRSAGLGRPDLAPIEGEAPPLATRELETKALRGHGGAVLRELVAETGAKHLVRVVAWPAGVVSLGDSLYVNGAWLVAMSAREEGDAGASSPAPLVVFRVESAAGPAPNGADLGSEGGNGVRPATTANASSSQGSGAAAGTTSGASPGSGNACSGCAKGCGSCAASCATTTCAKGCTSSSCDGNNGGGCGHGSGSGNSGCSVALERAPGSPLATAVWLVVPALVVAARGRRAASRARSEA